MSFCPPPEDLHALLEISSTNGIPLEIEAHIEDCGDCQAVLASATDSMLAELNLCSMDETSSTANEVGQLQQVIESLRCPDETVIGNLNGTQNAELASPTNESAPDWPGRHPNEGIGKYKVLKEIGRGGMGVLYEGIDTAEQQPVALKVLHNWMGMQPEALERLRREADAAMSVRHPNVIGVHEMISPEGQAPVIVMELLSGRTLADVFRERSDDVAQVKPLIKLLVGAARGIAAMNSSGLIHRDVKPSNLLCDEEADGSQRLIVGDLGLVRDEDATADLTRTENLLGTPAYMSPEQIERPNAVDLRSDIYSLGCVLYEILTGIPPFSGSVRMVLWQVANGSIRPPRDFNNLIHRDIETICMKALSRRPEERYSLADDFADDLERHLAGKSIQAKRPGPIRRLTRWSQRNPTLAVASGALTFILLATTITSVVVANTLADANNRETAAKNKAVIKEQEATAAAKLAEEKSLLAANNAQIAKDQSRVAVDTLASVVSEISKQLDSVAGTREFRKHLATISIDGLQKSAVGVLEDRSTELTTANVLHQIAALIINEGVAPDDELADLLRQDGKKVSDPIAVNGNHFDFAKRAVLRARAIAKEHMSQGEVTPETVQIYFDSWIFEGRMLDAMNRNDEALAVYLQAEQEMTAHIKENHKLLDQKDLNSFVLAEFKSDYSEIDLILRHRQADALRNISYIQSDIGNTKAACSYADRWLEAIKMISNEKPFNRATQDAIFSVLPEKIALRLPSGKDYTGRLMLLTSLVWRAKLLADVGRESEAKQGNEEAVDVAETLLTRRDRIEQPGTKISSVLRLQSLALERLGRLESATVAASEAAEILKRVLKDAPKDLAILSSVLYRLNTLGRLHLASGDLKAAVKVAKQCCDFSADAVGVEKTPETLRDAVWAQGLLGTLSEKSGLTGDAIEANKLALEYLAQAQELSPDDESIGLEIMNVSEKLKDLKAISQSE